MFFVELYLTSPPSASIKAFAGIYQTPFFEIGADFNRISLPSILTDFVPFFNEKVFVNRFIVMSVPFTEKSAYSSQQVSLSGTMSSFEAASI